MNWFIFTVSNSKGNSNAVKDRCNINMFNVFIKLTLELNVFNTVFISTAKEPLSICHLHGNWIIMTIVLDFGDN